MKRAGKRIIGIGIFHTFLYGYLVPFVIYPRFGDNGLTFAIIVAVIVSIAVLGKMLVKVLVGKIVKNNKGD